VYLSILEFIGHFHPFLVHLPIGILLVGLLLDWLCRKEKYRTLRPAIPFILICGVLSAFASCITGWILSLTDDYEKNLLGWHQWMGISVAFVSLLFYVKARNPRAPYPGKLLGFLLLVLLFITGHLGGSLTHGADYLSKPLAGIFGKDSTADIKIQPLADVQAADAYHDVVRPILETKCYSCHGARKQKGKLRMDDSLLLMKGGKDGKIIQPGNASGSELVKRLLLPVDNEDHMPPKEKPQPSESQIALLTWWINQGAGFGKKVRDIPQSENISAKLFDLQKVEQVAKKPMDIPEGNVEPADEKTLEQIKHKGIVILPLAQNSHWLMVNFVTSKSVDEQVLLQLRSLKKQLVWLKMDNTNLDDSGMASIGELTNLRRLSLQNTKITDTGLQSLRLVKNLQYLNLVGTRVGLQGILQLRDLKSLHSLYLYKTDIKNKDWQTLKSAFAQAQIDSGGYLVPLFSTDTIVIRAKKEYN
jgi:uncharacterized membrane protein